jgi:hypothetical protein
VGEFPPFFVFINMSRLSQQPLKVLLILSETLMQDNFYYGNPWDDAEDNLKLLRDKSGWIGIGIDYEDMEFIAAFIDENESIIKDVVDGKISKKDALDNLSIPKLEKFNIWYEVWGPATLTEKYRTTWQSYDFSYWEGDYEEHESDNFEPDNFEITSRRKVMENKKPILDKLVVENTTNLLDNLDRETLIQLRNLINQKLSSS